MPYIYDAFKLHTVYECASIICLVVHLKYNFFEVYVKKSDNGRYISHVNSL